MFQYMLLLRGATRVFNIIKACHNSFNTCSSCEEQRSLHLRLLLKDSFNTCSSCEEQLGGGEGDAGIDVSIHAPLARSNFVVGLIESANGVSIHAYKGRKGLLRATEVDLTQSGLMRSLRKSAENQCAKAGNRQEFALCETIVRGKETAGVSTSGRCVQRCTRRRRVSGLRHKTSRRRCLARTEPAPCKPDARVRPAAEQTTSTSTRSQPAASRGA